MSDIIGPILITKSVEGVSLSSCISLVATVVSAVAAVVTAYWAIQSSKAAQAMQTIEEGRVNREQPCLNLYPTCGGEVLGIGTLVNNGLFPTHIERAFVSLHSDGREVLCGVRVLAEDGRDQNLSKVLNQGDILRLRMSAENSRKIDDEGKLILQAHSWPRKLYLVVRSIHNHQAPDIFEFENHDYLEEFHTLLKNFRS